MSKSRFVSLVVALVSVAVVVGLWKFNYSPLSRSYDRYIIVNLMGLFWLPLLSVLLFLRADPRDLGFAPAASKRAWFAAGLMFTGLLVLMYFAAGRQVFQTNYPWFRNFSEFAYVFDSYPERNPYVHSPWLMLYAEASYGMYLFCWEFFFRGYMLMGLARSIGWAAVLVQAVAFGLLHYGKPMPEMVASFGAGIVLGVLAMSARSFVPGFVLHWGASVAFNLMVVARRPL